VDFGSNQQLIQSNAAFVSAVLYVMLVRVGFVLQQIGYDKTYNIGSNPDGISWPLQKGEFSIRRLIRANIISAEEVTHLLHIERPQAPASPTPTKSGHPLVRCARPQ
jgi:hypothetical protein